MSLSEEEENITLPFDRFSCWIHSICVITFDLELGQALELIYPNNAYLSETEKMNISYLSFPDSNTGCMGDTQYHFRMRLSAQSMEHLQRRQVSQRKTLTSFTRDCELPLLPQNGYVFGYVYFRQVRDKSIRRGYFQKSVVIMSPFPFLRLFHHVNSLLAPEFFEVGPAILEVACHDIDQWVAPQCPVKNETAPWLQLPLLGRVIQCQLVANSTPTSPPLPVNSSNNKGTTMTTSASSGLSSGPGDNQVSGPVEEDEDDNPDEEDETEVESSKSSSSSWVKLASDILHVIPMVHEVNYFYALYPVLGHLQLLWEIMITCQPLLIIAPNPRQCCEMVQGLVQMIQPITYCTDYRPYFTIQDSEFKEYTTRVQAPPSIVLGVTNPFFVKALSHWPNIIRLGDAKSDTVIEDDMEAMGSREVKRVKKSPSGSSLSSMASSSSGPMSRLASSVHFPSFSLSNGLASLTGGQQELRPGMYTQYQPCLQPSKTLYKLIKQGIHRRRHADFQSVLIRKFCVELTQSFMIPLERYVATLMPLKKCITPFKRAPSMGRFNLEEFIQSLNHAGPQLTSPVKGNWECLYRRFATTPLFAEWLAQRQAKVDSELQRLHVEALCEMDIARWCRDKAEVQLVDVLIQLNDLLTSHRRGEVELSESRLSRLYEHMETLLTSVPNDLSTVLRHSHITGHHE